MSTIPGPDVTYTEVFYDDAFRDRSSATTTCWSSYEEALNASLQRVPESFAIIKRYVRSDLVVVNGDGSLRVNA